MERNLQSKPISMGRVSSGTQATFVERDGLLGLLWPLQASLSDGQAPVTDASPRFERLTTDTVTTTSTGTSTSTGIGTDTPASAHFAHQHSMPVDDTAAIMNAMTRSAPMNFFTLPPHSIFGDFCNGPPQLNPLLELLEGDEPSRRGIFSRGSISSMGRGRVSPWGDTAANIGVGMGRGNVFSGGPAHDSPMHDDANHRQQQQQRLLRKPLLRHQLSDAPVPPLTPSAQALPTHGSAASRCPELQRYEDDDSQSDDEPYHPGDTYSCAPCQKQPRQVIIKIIKSPLVLAQEAEEARELARQRAAFFHERQPFSERYTKYLDYWRYMQHQRKDVA